MRLDTNKTVQLIMKKVSVYKAGELMSDLEKAKKILHEKNYTFVLLKDRDIVYTSSKKGIIPLMEIIRKDEHILNQAVIADRVIGKAAALLAAGYQVKELYADLISLQARTILEKNFIPYQFKQCVEYIQNRDKSDLCPMEKLAQDISDYQVAYRKILQFYKEVLEIDLT